MLFRSVEGETFRMEHGFHGFFPQYYNLKSLVSELAIADNFQSLKFYSVLFRGQNYAPEAFYPSHSAFPWNIVDLAAWSPNRFRWGINLTKPAHWQVFSAITGFRIPESYQRLDGISVAQWADQDIPRGLYDLYFLPFAKSTLNAPDLLSAGELLQFFHFYFFGNPEGLAFNGTRDDMGTSLVMPIANGIQQRGGQILREASISQFECSAGKITSVTYQQGGGETTVPFWVQRNKLLTDSQAKIHNPTAKTVMDYYGAGDRVFATTPGSKEALSLTCTHQGCTVVRQSDGKFRCPCHGAIYSQQGKVLQGPAKRDLAQFNIRQQQGESVQLAAVSPQSLSASQKIEEIGRAHV